MTAPPSPHHQRPFTDNDLCNQRQRLHSTDSYEWQFSAADARSQAEHVARLKSTLLTDAHNEFLHAAECCRHYSAESTAFAFDRFNSLKRQIEQDDRLRNSAEWQQMTAVHNCTIGSMLSSPNCSVIGWRANASAITTRLLGGSGDAD